ncbi:hypothetical protein [uncultured Sutterella sp.]|uniref:hypothetical protein n=1 Tax=uncultured Sutterella sp. TaxID=286133 RepID=UPI0026701743|nr:hypothetical protein [uncultured Sutterella sp.]
MATDANNLKLNKVTAATKAAFAEAVISNGSVYWDETRQCIVVGDGKTAGGIPQANAASVAAAQTAASNVQTNLNNYTKSNDAEVAKKLATDDLETALKELIVEFGGQVPA